MKVIITGPECTGKTTLANRLAVHYHVPYVKEYAREFLNKTRGKYDEKDLLTIAHGQLAAEKALAERSVEPIICDTGLEVLRIWSEWKFGHCDPFISQQAKQQHPDLYLLLAPDIDWEADPLRENPNDRDDLFHYYTKILLEYQVPVHEINGPEKERFKQAVTVIDAKMKFTE